MVEYSATFAIAKPIDMSKSSGVLFYSVPNRGNGAPVGSDRGHVNVSADGRAISRSRRRADHHGAGGEKSDGSPLTGPVFERLINMAADTTTLDLGTAPYVALTYQRPLTLDTGEGHPDAAHSPDAPARPRSEHRLGLRRLHQDAVPRHARSGRRSA